MMNDDERWQRRREAAWPMEIRLRWLDEAWELAESIARGREARKRRPATAVDLDQETGTDASRREGT